MKVISDIQVRGACEHNLKGFDIDIERSKLTVITGVSGSGKSSLAFDTVLAESQRRFFYTLSHYSRQFLDLGAKPKVRTITGLSPAIALAQNETMASRRSTVGSLTDVSELLGICFARFAETKCPKHKLATHSLSLDEFCKDLTARFAEENVAIMIPVATKNKGNFASRLTKLAARGYSKAFIDDDIITLSPIPELAKSEKHTIKVIVDVVKLSPKNLARCIRSFQAAQDEGEGFAEFAIALSAKEFDWKRHGVYSSKGGCPTCGFSWPALDTRYFSANSLGQCQECGGYGATTAFEDEEYTYEVDYDEVEDLGALDSEALRCPKCKGTGLTEDLGAITLDGFSAIDLQLKSLDDLYELVTNQFAALSRLKDNPAFTRVREQIVNNLAPIREVGLGYLQLSRRIRSLSGGELQRLKLAGILGDHLRGVLYVLDEPSQGLHAAEISRLCDTLDRLKNLGNTVIVVDHDETLMRRADWIVDLGPGGGANGGQLMAKFKPAQASKFRSQSITAAHLSADHTNEHRADSKLGKADYQFIKISKPRLHNLQMDEVSFLKAKFNVIAGVSGSGKSSLGLAIMYENAKEFLSRNPAQQKQYRFRFCESLTGLDSFKQVHLIDRKPVGKSSVSMPATYLDIFGILRDLYGKIPDAQVAGLDASDFSLMRPGGRCEHCSGRGEVNLKMRFLADARVLCDVCQGVRYRPHILDIRYNGLNMSEVLNLTIDQALSHFATFKKIQKLLAPAAALGLGYLKLGQSSASLSGGEAQRLKLVPFLVKQYNESSLLILDEPTTGLHFADVEKLQSCLRNLVNFGATVILIEHNLDVIQHADWLIELGPGSAHKGGKLLFEGEPQLLRGKQTPTAAYL